MELNAIYVHQEPIPLGWEDAKHVQLELTHKVMDLPLVILVGVVKNLLLIETLAISAYPVNFLMEANANNALIIPIHPLTELALVTLVLQVIK